MRSHIVLYIYTLLHDNFRKTLQGNVFVNLTCEPFVDNFIKQQKVQRPTKTKVKFCFQFI